MVNLQKSGDSAVKIVFTDSDHYLYGNGEVEVPVNSLLLVIDESEMVTFKKLSGDPFLSFRADNSNLGTKAAIEQFYKDNMVGSTGGGTGSGVTSGEVQTMIDDSLEDYYDKDEVDAAFDSVNATLSGKADTSAVTAVANDVSTLSGQVQTKVATSDFNTYTAATATALNGKVDTSALNDYYTKTEVYNKQEVDAAISGKADTSAVYTKSEVDTAIGSKQDTLVSGTNIKTINNESILGSGNINIQGGGANVIELTQAQYDALTTIDPDAIYVITDATAFDPSTKVDTSAITTSITSSSTNSEVAGAKAVYDAIQAGGGGGMDDDTQQLISTAFNDLNDRKADLTELSKYQKKGDYIKTSTLADYMTNASFDEYATAKERIISGALNDLNDKFGGIRLVKISQADYDNLATKDENTLYIIYNVI